MLADYLRIKIYIPDRSSEKTDPNDEFLSAISPENFLQTLIESIRAHPSIGVLGNYCGVYEIGPGLEGYSPTERANPTHGRSSEFSQIKNISFITYAPTSAFEAVDEFVEEVSREHPWEYPVIEVSNIRMWAP